MLWFIVTVSCPVHNATSCHDVAVVVAVAVVVVDVVDVVDVVVVVDKHNQIAQTSTKRLAARCKRVARVPNHFHTNSWVQHHTRACACDAQN